MLSSDKIVRRFKIRTYVPNYFVNKYFGITFFSDLLKGTFSSNQIDMLMKKNKKVNNWSSEDMTKAFTLRYLSKRSYIHVRNEMNIPLPSLTTLKDWAGKINLKVGVLEGVLNLMDIAARNMTPYEKLVVLQYDEMKVTAQYEYDCTNDTIIGPHEQLQVVMARSLCSSWKQPVFVGFDFKMNKSCLDEIVTKLFNVGFTVVAIVSDCGGGNVGVWKEFGVNYELSWFKSPITNQNVYFFADVPHLLKLVRNWFIDTGFKLSDGSLIHSEPVKTLVYGTKETEISSTYKLTPKHVECVKFERQNVRLAAQLMSHSTACALRRYEVGDETLKIKVADFIELTNNWFDVMNSYVPITSNDLNCAYGMKMEKQKDVLLEYGKVIESMETIPKDKPTHSKNSHENVQGENDKTKSRKNKTPKEKQALKLFQKGILMSTRSLINLYEDLSKNMGLKYIMTSKLNQDSLENLFSLLRSGGGLADHPSPMECVYRLRMIVLGKKSGQLSTNQNTKNTTDEFLIGKFLKDCQIPFPEISETPPQTEENDIEEYGSETNDQQEISSLDNTQDTMEPVYEDGLKYVAGWMARKLRKLYPKFIETEHTNDCQKSWIQELSLGGLTEPSEEFFNVIKNLESMFVKNTKKTANFKKVIGVKNLLTQTMKKEAPNVPKEVIDLFVRRRIAMRVKYLNKQRKNVTTLKCKKKLKKIKS